jgi:hypothetical protein
MVNNAPSGVLMPALNVPALKTPMPVTDPDAGPSDLAELETEPADTEDDEPAGPGKPFEKLGIVVVTLYEGGALPAA